MSRIIKPSTPAMVFDPVTGKSSEAPTTDIDEMARRAKVEAQAKEAAKAAREEKKKNK